MAKRQQPGCGCCTATVSCSTSCSPCAIPTQDLTLTRTPGPFVSTLVYNSTGPTWSDGSYTFQCTAGTATLSGPGGPWFPTVSNCTAWSVQFGAGAVLSTITGNPPSGSFCCQVFVVLGCNGLQLSGVSVNVYDTSGGTLLTSGTTNSTGRVTLLWTKASSPCSVWVEFSRSRFTTDAASYTLTSGGQTGITLSPTASYVCSLCCTTTAIPQPRTLFLTDINGTYSLTYTTTGGLDIWYVCTSATANPTMTNGSPCVAGGSASIPIYYNVTCASSNSWAVNRQWSEARAIGSGPWYYHVDASCGALGISGGGCTGISIGAAQRQAMTFDCTAIAFSNTLTTIGGNLSDPIGGTVTVSE
jgi:hypothetical protein